VHEFFFLSSTKGFIKQRKEKLFKASKNEFLSVYLKGKHEKFLNTLAE